MVTRSEKSKLLSESDSDSDAGPPGRQSSHSRSTSAEHSSSRAAPADTTPTDMSDAPVPVDSQLMESITEGFGDASLQTPEKLGAPQATLNPLDENEIEPAAISREEECVNIQSRLPFVPRRQFSLEGVTEDERK
eukprot:666825-Rhodomonas_salina.1